MFYPLFTFEIESNIYETEFTLGPRKISLLVLFIIGSKLTFSLLRLVRPLTAIFSHGHSHLNYYICWTGLHKLWHPGCEEMEREGGNEEEMERD